MGPRAFCGWLEAADEEFALVDHLGGEMVVEEEEELFVVHDFAAPGGAVDFLSSSKVLVGGSRGPSS